MSNSLRLMCVVAHPDDEALGAGFALAKYAAEGIHTSIIMATRGERGWQGNEEDNPGLQALGQIRETELLTSVEILGVHDIAFLDYLDGELDQVNPTEIQAKIAHQIRRVRPQVVITFDPFGAYGHPDHIAISQFTLGGVMIAANCSFVDPEGYEPHQVSKVYYIIQSEPLVQMYTALAGREVSTQVGDQIRKHTPWPDWAATARVDATAYWETAVKAIASHYTQVANILDLIHQLPKLYDPSIWAVQTYYRVFSLVNSGRQVETDLFEGLR